MPRKAFLKNKSLLDRFKDDYATHTGYIQSARAEHTWNNPLTRRKRTKELNRWIKSFAGKDHIHKLARFNAMQAGKNESAEYNVDCLRYGSTLELPNGVCVKVKETIRCPRRAAFIFRVLAIVEGEDGFVIHGFYPVYGLERRPSEEFDLHSDDATALVSFIENNMFNSRGESMPHKLTIKLHETKFDPSQYDFFIASYTLNGNDRSKTTNGIVDAQGTLEDAQKHGATNLKLVGVKDNDKTEIPMKSIGISEHKNEAMSLKGFLENLTEKLTKQFNLDAEKVQAYLDSHTQEMQELLDDKDLSLKEKVLLVRSEITGEQDEAKKHEGYGGTKSVMSIWGNRPRDVYPEVSYSSVNDMYNTLLKYGYGEKHPIYYKNNSPEQIKGHILGYFKWTPTNSDADIEADALAAATMIKNNFNKSESKEPADEKLGYEKGHKNSRGEDAPWVIRSHEDNRILASFANKKDAEEHMKRMKQYSKQESKSADELDKYIKDVKSLLKSKYNMDFNDKDTCRLNVGWLEKLDAMFYQGKPVEDGAKEVAAFCGYNSNESKKSEDLESYACYIDFGSEDAAKDGMKLVNRWNPLRNGTAVMVDGIGKNAANSLWKDWLDQCIKAGLDIMDNGEVYKEEPSCIYSESKKSEALFNKTEMENVAIKAAVKAAWSAAKVKYFRIDFRNTHPGELNVYPVTSDGKDVGPFWGVSADKGIVYQYSPAWDDSGKDEVVREMKFKDVDGIEEIFTDEFIAMDDTLEVSMENGGADIVLIDSSDAKDESKKSEDSDNSGESKAWCVTVEYKSGDGETEKINVVTQRHDTEEQARQAGIAYVKDKYAPANDINVISAKRLPKWASRNIQNLVKNKNKSEDADDVAYELTEDAVTDLLKELSLEIVNTWYDGNKDRIVYDCKDMCDEDGETVCVWVEPPYEARVWLKDVNPRVNQLVEDIGTIDALKAALVDIFKIELGESHITESLRKPEDTIIVPNWLWETYTLGENYDGDTLTDDEQQTYLDFKEKYEGFNLKAVSEKTTFRSDNDFDSNGCPCYEVNVFKK